MKSALPIEARRPRDEVVDVLATTLIQMLARGLVPDRDDEPAKEEPAPEAEANPCH